MDFASSIAAIVVVYNKACRDSSTCNCLEKMKTPLSHIVIFDNSTSDYGNRSFCEQKGWCFLGGEGNLGLSKAYNRCIDFLKEQDFTGTICLFDDDTDLSEDYFSALEKALSEKEAKIHVPLIFSAGNLISPSILDQNHRRKLFSSPHEALSYPEKDLSAINSCMAIKMSVFENYRYDENIFLDGIDHHFLDQMRKNGYTASVFDYHCNHSFSGKEKPPFAAALARFRIYAKDYRYIFRDKPMAYLKLVGKRALSLCIKYKRIDFLRYL